MHKTGPFTRGGSKKLPFAPPPPPFFTEVVWDFMMVRENMVQGTASSLLVVDYVAYNDVDSLLLSDAPGGAYRLPEGGSSKVPGIVGGAYGPPQNAARKRATVSFVTTRFDFAL